MAETTKTLILQEALYLFLEKGYHGASMRMLAKRIGLRESSIYNHFQSKQAIFTELIQMAGPQLTGLHLEELLDNDKQYHPTDLIRQVIKVITETWIKETDALLFLLIIRESPLFSFNVKTRSGAMVQKALLPLTHFIENLQNQGIFKTDFPAHYFSWSLLAPIANLRLNYLLPNACDEDKATGKRLIQLHLDCYITRNFIIPTVA